jgi:hypothetical protein
MALIPAAQGMLATFLAAIVVGGLLAWIFEFLIGKIAEVIS